MTTFNQSFDELGIEVEHCMPGEDGVYIKVVRIPANRTLANHIHTFTHKSILVSGSAVVEVDGEPVQLTGPRVLTIARGVPHQVSAITDVVWYCVHATHEDDPNRIDFTLTGG